MNQPLSYIGFILCLVLTTICFIAAVYLSYRKSSRLRDMVQFVVSPKDDLVLDFKITSIIKTALWLILIHVSITVVYHFADLMFYSESAEGSPYTAACTGRNSLPSASQTQETIHYIVKCSGNVLYIGHHIFLQGLRCYMGKTSFLFDYSIGHMVLGL